MSRGHDEYEIGPPISDDDYAIGFEVITVALCEWCDKPGVIDVSELCPACQLAVKARMGVRA